MPPITTNSEPTDLWPKTPLFIEQSSVSALSHHDPSSAGFTTNIAESNIWYAQGRDLASILGIASTGNLNGGNKVEIHSLVRRGERICADSTLVGVRMR